MSVRNQNWYNLNEGSAYPIQDGSTMLSDVGDRLPENIICDLNLRYPATYGQAAFIGACAVSDHLVTVVILASQSAALPLLVSPIAAITLPKPIDIYRPYALEALVPGAGGWIVFGDGVSENYSGRFLDPTQTLLLARAASAYDVPPVHSLGVYGAAAGLTGLVKLVGGNDIEVVKETRTIDSVEKDVAVVRLKAMSNAYAGRNLLDVYRGPCGSRPESNTCGEPAPIEFLGPVQPDSDGNIIVTLAGPVTVTGVNITDEVINPAVDAHGVVIDCSHGLTSVCNSKRNLPDAEGHMPGDDVSCDTITIPDEDPAYLGEVAWTAETLPECTTYEGTWNADFDDPGWVDIAGAMRSADGSTICDVAGVAGVMLCLRAWPVTMASTCRQMTLKFKLLAGTGNEWKSAGLVFGYGTVEGKSAFYTADVAWDPVTEHKILRVRYWRNWSAVSTIVHEVETPDLAVDTEYTLLVEIGAATELGAAVTATLTCDTDPAINYTTGTELRYPLTGNLGLFASRAFSEFTSLAYSYYTES